MLVYKELIESSGETDKSMVLGADVETTKSTRELDSCNSCNSWHQA